MNKQECEVLMQKCRENHRGDHNCPVCGKATPNERVVIIGSILCRDCTPQPRPIYGIMEYSEKAVGSLVITDDEKEFRELKKPANQRR